MHPVANEVPVPIDAIERKLLKFARPGFTGPVRVHRIVTEQAGLAVDAIVEATEKQSARETASHSPEMSKIFSAPHEPTARQVKLKTMLAANKHRFTIGTKLTDVILHFKDGEWNNTDWVTVG